MRELMGPKYVFDPTNLTINPGDTVKWTNAGSVSHDATHNPANPPRLWASPLLGNAASTNSFSYTFNTAGLYPYFCDTHFLRGHAEETGTVAVVSLNVSPSVSIKAPTNGTPYFAPASFAIQAEGSDSDGTVTQVQFFRGSTPLGTSTNSPSLYSNNVSSLGTGTYALTAVATDNQGAKTTSGVVNVKVSAPPRITLASAQWRADGGFQFRISGGAAGQPCAIEACGALPNWMPVLTTNFPNTPCPACPFIDFIDGGTNLNRRFYRSRVFP